MLEQRGVIRLVPQEAEIVVVQLVGWLAALRPQEQPLAQEGFVHARLVQCEGHLVQQDAGAARLVARRHGHLAHRDLVGAMAPPAAGVHLQALRATQQFLYGHGCAHLCLIPDGRTNPLLAPEPWRRRRKFISALAQARHVHALLHASVRCTDKQRNYGR